VHDSECAGVFAGDGDSSNRDVALRRDMLVEHVAVIHAVELIAAEDDEVFKTAVEEIGEVLADGIGSALIPARVRGRLLRGEDFHEAARELIELVGRLNVAMQRDAVELREHVDAAQAGVDTVRNRDIDDAIFSAERHCGFAAVFGEWVEPSPGSAAHDDCECSVGDAAGSRHNEGTLIDQPAIGEAGYFAKLIFMSRLHGRL
jgi:hypothetical protein